VFGVFEIEWWVVGIELRSDERNEKGDTLLATRLTALLRR
jgi:hypothetical protein